MAKNKGTVTVLPIWLMAMGLLVTLSLLLFVQCGGFGINLGTGVYLMLGFLLLWKMIPVLISSVKSMNAPPAVDDPLGE